MKTKVFFKSTAVAVCCLTSFAFASCSKNDDTPPISHLTFDKNKVELAEGNKVTVKVGGGVEPYKVTTGDAKIATATVEKNVITITAVKKGGTVINVSDKNKKSGIVTVVVKDAASALTFDKPTVTLAINKTEQVTVKGGTGPYMAVVQTPTIASAEVKGNVITVKGLKTGATTITVNDKDKNVGTIAVTIK
jgi:hypothetical protein